MKYTSRIASLGHAVPQRCVGNVEIETRLGLESGWIERRTGIRSRRWAAPEETLSGIAAKAGQAALDDAGIAPADIGLVLLATSTPDQPLPPSAPLVAHHLNLTQSGAIDLAGACAGFLYALILADGFVRTQGKPVLVIAANILSRRINPDERATAAVFGDAAGAALLVPSHDPDSGVLGVDLASDGDRYGLIGIPAGGSTQPVAAGMDPTALLMTMTDGRTLFTQAVSMMTQSSRRALHQARLQASEIDHFVPHQANARISQRIADNLAIPADKTLSSIEDFGNASAATIPLTLSLAKQDRKLRPGQNLLLAAAGAGLTGGAIALRL